MRLCRQPRTLEILSPPYLGRLPMRVSAQLGDTSVDTVRLLAGMLREDSGVAGSVLASHNIDAEAVLMSCKSFSTVSDVTLPEVESRCLSEAEWLTHNYVGTEYLMLAVCSFSDCRAAIDLCATNEPRATSGSQDFASKRKSKGPFVAQSSLKCSPTSERHLLKCAAMSSRYSDIKTALTSGLPTSREQVSSYSRFQNPFNSNISRPWEAFSLVLKRALKPLD